MILDIACRFGNEMPQKPLTACSTFISEFHVQAELWIFKFDSLRLVIALVALGKGISIVHYSSAVWNSRIE